MKRMIARRGEWWIRLCLLSVIAVVWFDPPSWVSWPLVPGLYALALVRSPWDRDREPVVVPPPVRGRWTVLNSPATKVPSHGIRAYGQTYAIDILRPRPPGTPAAIGWGIGMRRADSFPSYGEPVLAVADGTVVAASSRQRDHRSRLTWPSLAYLMTVEAFVREVGGTRFVLGNHVIIDHGDGVYGAYAHLRRGSLQVAVGDEVRTGQQLAEIGNSGNTSEPHLHVQLMDDPAVTAAAGLPFRWDRITLTPGDVDPSLSRRPVAAHTQPGLPANGQIFTTA